MRGDEAELALESHGQIATTLPSEVAQVSLRLVE
jgi:hypothetical protein